MVDVAMISAQSPVAGDVDVNPIAAVVWRAFYSLLAFFPGAITLSRFAKTHGDLLREAGEDLGADAEMA